MPNTENSVEAMELVLKVLELTRRWLRELYSFPNRRANELYLRKRYGLRGYLQVRSLIPGFYVMPNPNWSYHREDRLIIITRAENYQFIRDTDYRYFL